MAKTGKPKTAARANPDRGLPNREPIDSSATRNRMADRSLEPSRESRSRRKPDRLEALAIAALETLLQDKTTPPGALASAVRIALQLSGALERSSGAEALEMDPESMSAADIDRALDRMLDAPKKRARTKA